LAGYAGNCRTKSRFSTEHPPGTVGGVGGGPIEPGYPSGKGKSGNGDLRADSCDLPLLVLRGAQPGDSQYIERIVAVSAGEGLSIALDVNGFVLAGG